MTEIDKKKLTAQQKAKAALEAARAIKPIDDIAHEYGVQPTEVRQWVQTLIRNAASLFEQDSLPFPCSELVQQRKQRSSANAPYLQVAMPIPEEIAGDFVFDVFPHDPAQSQSNDMGAEITCDERGERREAQLVSEQRQVNEALVFKILECQRAEEAALREAKNRLHQLVAHQEQTKEDERKRIAREIHDELGQNLMALRIDISMLHGRTATRHPHLHKKVGVVLSNLDVTIKSVRSIIHGLRPFALELGLQAAIESNLKKFEQVNGVVCQLSIDAPRFGDGLNDEQSLAVFRILQESLTNIARHSQATKAEVMLSWNDRTFSMTVKDNGIGIYPSARRKSTFGLLGIQERVSALHGELLIDSGCGKGTALTITLPVEKGT